MQCGREDSKMAGTVCAKTEESSRRGTWRTQSSLVLLEFRDLWEVAQVRLEIGKGQSGAL